jgi:hypothetical protein
MLTKDSVQTYLDRLDFMIGGQLEIKEVWMAYQSFQAQSIRSAIDSITV